MTRVTRLILVLLIIPKLGFGEFTPEEKEQVLRQVNSLYDAARAGDFLAEHVQDHLEDTNAVVAALNALLRAHNQHLGGLLYLLDVEGGGTNTNLETKSRAEVLALALAELEEDAASSYRTSLEEMNAILSSCETECGSIQTAVNLVTASEEKRLSFDGSLAYLEPRLEENMADGATREESTAVFPHGDYRMYGQNLNNYHRRAVDAWRKEAEAAERNPAYALDFANHSYFHGRNTRRSAIIAGLLVGVEHSKVRSDIDLLFDNGTTRRSRHFWRMLIVAEMLVSWDHRRPHHVDVFGRRIHRGTTYDLAAVCGKIGNSLQNDPEIAPYAKSLIESMHEICQAWAPMDGIVQDLLVFRFATNVGPPGQVVGVCDSDTTELTTINDKPTCVGTGESQATCGDGTTLVDGVCVAEPVECPTFAPVLDVLPDAIQARCVEAP